MMIAGVGPGNPKYLTREVYEYIENTKIILGFGRVSETLREIRDDIIPIYTVKEIDEFLKKETDFLLLASGDPLFFGITSYLKSKGVKIDKICPGISSFQYLSSKCHIPWNQATFFSLHGRNFSLEQLKDKSLAIGFIDKDHLPSKISKQLYEIGIRGYITVGYNLSYEEEKIERVQIGDPCCDLSELAVVVIENEMVKG